MSNLATITNNILADSGIDDINVVVTNGSYSNPSWITALSWTKITDRPNTIAGYGITDAYTQTQVNNLLAGYLPLTGGTLTGPLNGTSIALTAGITPTKTAKNAYAIQIRGAFYGAPRLQLYDLAADPNAFIGLGVDMSGAAYEFSNYFPRTGGNGRWSVGSWAGDFGTGQYVSGYNEKLFITENAAQFNVAFTLSNLAGSGTRMVVADANGLLSTQAIGSGSITGSGTTNYIPKFTGSTTVGNSNLVDVSGYLVLGNTSSVYGQAGRGTFEMNGSADNILAMRIGGSLAGYLYTNSSNMELYSTTNIQLSTAGTIRAALFSDGNFTLSNSPSNAGFKLDVNGTGRYSGNLQLGTIGGGSGTATPNNINLTSTFSTTAGSNLKLILFNDTGGNIYGLGVSNSQMDFSVPVGANYRFYTGNVGIGATPNQRLQVDGGSLLVNSGTAGNTSFRDIMIGGISGWSNNESHGIDAVYGSSGSPVTFSRIESHFNGVSGRIRFRNLFNNSAPQTSILMTIEGNGNVLIGDTSDNGAMLQVNGNIRAGNISAVTNTIGTVDIGFSGGGYSALGYNISYTSTSNVYQYKVNDTSWMLDLGNANLFRLRYAPSGVAGNTISYGNLLTINTSGLATFISGVRASNFAFNAYSGGGEWQIGSDAATGSGLYLYQTSFGYSVIISSSGAATFSSGVTAGGNIQGKKGTFGTTGIGTPSLLVSDNDQSNVRLRLQNTGSGNAWDLVGGLNASNNSDFSIYDVANNNTVLRIVPNSGNATFSSSVTAGGFFASGSNNFVRFTSTGTADWGTVIVGSAGGARTTLLVGQSGYSNGFTVEYTGSAMRYIFRDGNVGIGPISSFPNGESFLIQNSGVWNVTMGLNNTGAGGGQWNIFSTNNSFSQGAGRLLFYNTTAGSDAMVIDSSNRVGIGTNSPGTLLHVNGSGTIGRFQSSISYVDLSFINSTSSNGFIQYNGNNFNFFANSGSTPTMTITGGAPGNVLIGNINDNGLGILQVNGNIILAGGSSSGQTQLSSGFTTIRFPNQFSSGFTDAGVKLFIFNSGATIQGFTAGPQYDLQYHSSGSSSGRHAFYVGNQEIIRFNQTTVVSTGSITATSFFESSDATLKTLVEDNYQAKGIDSVVAKLYIKNGKEELGYFAQDLQEVLPSAVSKGSDGLLNLSYREVHTAKIAYLEERIKQLEKKYENN